MQRASQAHDLAALDNGLALGAHPDRSTATGRHRQFQIPGDAQASRRFERCFESLPGTGFNAAEGSDGGLQFQRLLRVVLVDAENLSGARQLHAAQFELPAADLRHLAGAALKVCAVGQRQRGPLAVGDFLQHADTPRQLAVLARLRLADMMNPADITLGRHDAVFDVEFGPGLHRALAGRFEIRPVDRVHELQKTLRRAIKGIGLDAEQCIDLVGPPKGAGGQISLPVADTADALRALQTPLHAQAALQLGLQGLVALQQGLVPLLQRFGHEVEALSHTPEFAAGAGWLGGDAYLQPALLNLPVCCKQLLRGLDERPPANTPSQHAAKQTRQCQRGKLLCQRQSLWGQNTAPVGTDHHIKVWCMGRPA